MPLAYSMIGVLLVQKADPRALSIMATVVSSGSCILTRLLWTYVHGKITEHQEKHKHKDRFSRMEKRIKNYFDKKESLGKYSEKIKNYTERAHGKFALGLVIIFLLQSAVPDVIAIRFLHKKIPFRYFSVTAIIGKAIVYVPFVFIGQSLISLLKAKLGR